MDKFPEAFKRFEKTVNIRDLSKNEVIAAFIEWAGYKWIPTSEQTQALNHEIRKRGISEGRFERTWRFETVRVRGKGQVRYRDLRSGRFIRRPR
jgi:hypothetical protein